MWQPTVQAPPAGVPAGTVQTRSTRSPEWTTIRIPATSGGTLTTGVGPGGAPAVGSLGDLPGVLDRRVADDRLVDLETAVDDVEQDRFARRRGRASSGRNE